ncbi:protein B4 isoform X2 [Rhinatrema bivittatum]|uniref:protein B4 isoform X2 n=1 Tax=Rhinatrema bivittatum TaxID=194408 RepID=UPI00112A8A22|nr:protein B4 isoform X2 [Rhinatrema bivittatum]
MPPKKAAALLEEPLKSDGKADVKEKSTVVKTLSIGHPPTLTMVVEALKKYNDRKGTSVQAIRSHILATHPSVDPGRLTFMLRKAFAKGIETGVLARPPNSTALGAIGRYKLVTKKPKVASRGAENVDPNAEQPPKAMVKALKKPKSKADVGQAEKKSSDAKTEKTKPVSKKARETSSKDKPKAAAKDPGRVAKTGAKKVDGKQPNKTGAKGATKEKTEKSTAKAGTSSEQPAPGKKNGGAKEGTATNGKQVKKR